MSLEAARASTRATDRELMGACIALAKSAAGASTLGGMEVESEASRASLEHLEEARRAAGESQARLRELGAQHGMRIGAGYACAAVLLASIVYAASGSDPGSRRAPGDSASSGNVESTGGSGGESFAESGSGGQVPVAPREEGAVYVPSAMSNNQTSVCVKCNGSGQASCVQCFGVGTRSCFNCNGRGQTFNNTRCFQCNGTGQQDCLFCTYGRNQCPDCLGMGRK